ncbi:unnamed protein product, partial [Acanthoscelides obtectus]
SDLKYKLVGASCEDVHQALSPDKWLSVAEVHKRLTTAILATSSDIRLMCVEMLNQLQGRDKELAEMLSGIKAFIKKLELWEENLIHGIFLIFQNRYLKVHRNHMTVNIM